jgi:hypothetical protein
MTVPDQEFLRRRPTALLVISSQLVAWLLAGSALVLASACGVGSLRNPAAPSAVAGVVMRVTPAPLTLRRTVDPAPAFLMNAAVRFENTRDSAVTLVALDVELSDAAGRRERQRLPLDLTVAPGQSATRSLSDAVPVRAMPDPVEVTFTAAAVDGSGEPFSLQPASVPAVVVAPPPSGTANIAAPVTFVGAGDIANCALSGAESTARLLDAIPGEVFTLGDHVYPNGTAEAFAGCYESTWGRHRGRTRPTPGNHDWDVHAGTPYLAYFGGAAAAGFYSFNLGAWHVLSLNSNVNAQPGSPQYEWARADLAASAAPCTLAYWHHPLFSSGPNGNNGQMRSMWRLLDNAGVELVLVGHDHLYERFAPQDADGRATPTGMRQFTVGTGGAQPYGAVTVQPNSEMRIENAWGVLKLTLRTGGFDWEFVPAVAASTRDFGSSLCSS